LPGFIKVTKRAEGTGQLLRGAVFGIYDATTDVKISELTTGADGAAVSGVLPEGAYYLLEKQAPKGFTINPDRVYFVLKAGETKEMTLTNARKKQRTSPTALSKSS
jgi:uncharacterized surface anchored protein